MRNKLSQDLKEYWTFHGELTLIVSIKDSHPSQFTKGDIREDPPWSPRDIEMQDACLLFSLVAWSGKGNGKLCAVMPYLLEDYTSYQRAPD